MISGWSVVLQKTSAMFLIMVAGWIASRKGLWTSETGRILSRLLIDIIYPCYVIAQFLRTVDAENIRSNWYIPFLGYAVIALGAAVAYAGSPFITEPRRRRTFVFLVAITNWIYLPLPIAEGLFGEAGVRTILLMNVGCTAAIWSIGVGIMNPGMSLKESVRHIILNAGIMATAAGLLLAIFVPGLRNGAMGIPVMQPVLNAAELMGQLMIPLSLLVIGAQLGEHPPSSLKPDPPLILALVFKLIAVPALTLAIIMLLNRLGFTMPDEVRLTVFLVSAMPPALTCTLFAERYNGDSLLSANTVFMGTFASLATVPIFIHLIQKFNL